MKDLTLPPLPEIPKSEIIPYSAIRYVAGYTESFVHKYAQDYARAALSSHHEDGGRADTSELEQMRARKDAAYLERNQVVAALAKCFPSGVARTAIEGWSEDWHGCVYIDLPTGQASWHFHDSHAYLFDGLPPYMGTWDGHDTPEKYARLAKLAGVALGGEPPCNPHPDAPHGYNRNASHNAGRYVCDCEGWAALGGEKGEAVAEIEPEFEMPVDRELFAFISGTPLVASLLYDINLLPEQITKPHHWDYMLAVCGHMKEALAAPVGKARMLTDLEITRCWEATFGYLELGIAIQHKFCEKNGIEVLS